MDIDLERRKLLGTVGYGSLGIFSLPTWFESWWGEQSTTSRSLLKTTRIAAAEDGRPLFVLVVPGDDDLMQWRWGELFGALLLHGHTEALAALQMCTIVCAKADQIKAIVRRVDIGSAPIALLDPADPPSVTLPELPALTEAPDWQNIDPFTEMWVEQLSNAVVRIVAPSQESVEQWQQRARAAHPEEAASFDLGDRSEPLMDIIPALFYGEGDIWHEHLAQRHLERMAAPVRGGRWANAEGCGVDFEDEDEQSIIGCGMGHVSPLAVRFLYFYTSR